MPEPDETPPAQPDPSLPTNLGGIDPGELLARGMQSAKMSGGGAHGWLPPTPQEVAHLFPSYEILSMLGRGGMGAVYKARQTALDRLVAIKLLPLEISVDRDFADRFRREARAMAKLNHPHIIAVHDFGQTGEGHLFFAMEFVEGANLHDIIHGPGLAPDQALVIAAQVCTALAYAHAKGVVHRDIKPANVMLDTESQVKVADFGLARLTDTSATDFGHTQTGTVMGTPDYMAPEQKRGMNVDHRADIYSLGVMLYEMLCRETPQGAFELPSARTGCDPRLDAIVLKAMQQTPERRYQSTQEMKTDVETARTPLPASPPPSAAPRPLPKALPRAPKIAGPPVSAKKSRTPLWIASAAALVVLVGAGVFFSKHRGKDAGTGTGKITESASIAKATTEQPFVNTLGMKFVPVPITGGQRVLFSVWETRVQDYAEFARVSKVDDAWTKQEKAGVPVSREPEYPVVGVSWDETNAFCEWLTKKESAEGKLPKGMKYRLPTDEEWSCAVGLQSDPGVTPKERHANNKVDFPWGTGFPPPKGKVGNFADSTWHKEFPKERWIEGYTDGYATTAPVGSFAPNKNGIYDLGGNVWEWCEDLYDPGKSQRVLRGPSWNSYDREFLLSSSRIDEMPNARTIHSGFRCVLAPATSTPPAAGAKETPIPAGVAQTPAPSKKSPGGVLTFGGHRYQYVTAYLDWEQARAKAESMGGHLVTFSTPEEEAWVLQTFPTPFVWIGGFAREKEFDLHWVTGEPFGKLRWANGHPRWRSEKGGGDARAGTLFAAGLSLKPPEVMLAAADSRVGGFIVEWEDSPASPTAATATKDAPFVNTLGMKFVPVPITGGPTGGQRVLFSVWETRVQDYEVFAKELKRKWEKPGFEQGPTHPAVNVSWDDAQAFCTWLTDREHKSGKLAANERYRLPSDHEWSCAVGIGDREDPLKLPSAKHQALRDVYPWGAGESPAGAGNYSGEETAGRELWPWQKGIVGYRDEFPETAPVGSFAANRFGLFDLGGNAWEWCQDLSGGVRFLRGASFGIGGGSHALSSFRNAQNADKWDASHGFRVVLAPATATPPAAKP